MSTSYQIVVCAGIVPDSLQMLEPVALDGPAAESTKASYAEFYGVGNSEPMIYSKHCS